MGSIALGISSGDDVKVLNEAPGPHSMMAWKPGAGRTACGILDAVYGEGVYVYMHVHCTV